MNETEREGNASLDFSKKNENYKRKKTRVKKLAVKYF